RHVCGQCLRGRRTDDCEYMDKHTRSRAEMLEEDISRIESRIYELEHPAEATGESVLLHHLYKQPRRRANMPRIKIVDLPELACVIDAFLPYTSDWGFFLDPARFRQDALLPLPIGHHSRPTPALLTAVYLIGIVLSDSPTFRMHENIFLLRALSSLSGSLSGLDPLKTVHALQTEILLSNYLYASGRLLEGRYHTTAAVSLAVSRPQLKNEAVTATLWPDAHTTESLDACWMTIILDKSWSIALAMHPNLDADGCSGMIELPWPRYDCPYHLRFDPIHQLSTPQSHSTVARFLEGTEISIGAASAKTLLAKATILWQRVNNLIVGWKPDVDSEESSRFSIAFDTLDLRIHDFQDKLTIAPAPNSRALVVGHSIAHAAVIQLHGTFAQATPKSKQKCLAAAKSILVLIDGTDLRDSVFINPVMGTIWVAACEVAVDEITVLRASRSRPAGVPTAAKAALAGLFARAVEAMRRFESSPLMSACCVVLAAI
ncbi:hypothetical protein B0H17DRAFT_929059, partial [Mycena rosella]